MPSRDARRLIAKGYDLLQPGAARRASLDALRRDPHIVEQLLRDVLGRASFDSPQRYLESVAFEGYAPTLAVVASTPRLPPPPLEVVEEASDAGVSAWIDLAFVDQDGEPVEVAIELELPSGRVSRITSATLRLTDQPGNASLRYELNPRAGARQTRALPGRHEVRPGQDMLSIAWAYGHTDWESVWNDSNNDALRESCPDPTALTRGQVVYVPEPPVNSESLAMDQRHEITVEVPRRTLEIALEGTYEDELASARYEVVVGETTLSGDVSAETIKVEVPFTARSATLRLWFADDAIDPDGDGSPSDADANADDPPPDVETTILLSQLMPSDTLLGVQGRLRNLGLYGGRIDDDLAERTRGALSLLLGDTHEGTEVSGDARNALGERHA